MNSGLRPPPFLIGITLLFWGWETGLFFYGFIAACIFEGSRILKWRLDLSASDFQHIWDFCTAIIVVGVVFCYLRDSEMVIPFVRWIPLIYFPFVAAQAYSSHNRTSLSTFFWLLRKKGDLQKDLLSQGIGFGYPYFVLCLFSASAANARDIRFYAGLCLLLPWAMWSVRNRGVHLGIWAACFLLIAMAGYFGHLGLHKLQAIVENKTAELFYNYANDDVELSQTRTAIGSIGTLKRSNQIVLRVEPFQDNDPPELLRRASYNRFKSVGHNSTWYSPKNNFEDLLPEADQTTWKLLSQRDTPLQSGALHIKTATKKDRQSVTIWTFLTKGMGVLALPKDTFEIQQLPVFSMQRNQFGSVRVEGGPNMIRYMALYDQALPTEIPPDHDDLTIPEKEIPTLGKIVTELQLTASDPQQTLDRLSAFFQDHFSYSLVLKGSQDDPLGKATSISHFLLRSRAGHCEYFATATVLLLRQVGIPARYTIGYSIQECDKLTGMYIIRASHAHAWASVYINGAWKDFDTTPASWVEIEEKDASAWKPITDFFSWIWFEFSKWRWFSDKQNLNRVLVALFVIVVGMFVIRIFLNRKKSHPKLDKKNVTQALPMFGTDSEFYLIEKRLMDLGLPRFPSETLTDWIRRIALRLPKATTERGPPFSVEGHAPSFQLRQSAMSRRRGPSGVKRDLHPENTQPLNRPSLQALQPLIALHYRYRFDPDGLNEKEREMLRSNVQSWLKNPI